MYCNCVVLSSSALKYTDGSRLALANVITASKKGAHESHAVVQAFQVRVRDFWVRSLKVAEGGYFKVQILV